MLADDLLFSEGIDLRNRHSGKCSNKRYNIKEAKIRFAKAEKRANQRNSNQKNQQKLQEEYDEIQSRYQKMLEARSLKIKQKESILSIYEEDLKNYSIKSSKNTQVENFKYNSTLLLNYLKSKYI